MIYCCAWVSWVKILDLLCLFHIYSDNKLVIDWKNWVFLFLRQCIFQIHLSRFKNLPNCSVISCRSSDARSLRSSSCQISYLPPVTPQSLLNALDLRTHIFFYFWRIIFGNFVMERSNSTQIPFNRRVPISDTNIWIFLLIIRSRFERCWQGPNKASNGRPPKFFPESDPHLEIPTHLGFTPPCHDIFTPLFDFLWTKYLKRMYTM